MLCAVAQLEHSRVTDVCCSHTCCSPGHCMPAWVPMQDVDILRTRPATGGRPGPTRFNQVVYNRGMLFLAGQIVDDTSAPGMDTYYGQARQVLHQVEQLLGESGSSMQWILQASLTQPLSCACSAQSASTLRVSSPHGKSFPVCGNFCGGRKAQLQALMHRHEYAESPCGISCQHNGTCALRAFPQGDLPASLHI